jgi:hypothetical protein
MAMEWMTVSAATGGFDVAGNQTYLQEHAENQAGSTNVYPSGGQNAASLELSLEGIGKSLQAQLGSTQKVLHYNDAKISSAIGRAENLVQSNSALTDANSNLNIIQCKAASSSYDDEEIRNALKQAKEMVISARTKMRDLKMEAMQTQIETVLDVAV